MKKNLLDVLEKELLLLNEAAKILKRSYEICQKIGVKDSYPIEEIDHFEALTNRFARLSDIVIQKMFRLIDAIDLETEGSVRDRINRAEKKALIDDANTFIEIRILRNDIAHEYMEKAIQQIFKQVMKKNPALLDCVEKIKIYAKNMTEH